MTYLSSSRSGRFSLGFCESLVLSLTVSSVSAHNMPIIAKTLTTIAATLDSGSLLEALESVRSPEDPRLCASIFTVRTKNDCVYSVKGNSIFLVTCLHIFDVVVFSQRV